MQNNVLPLSKEGWNNISYAIATFILLVVFDFEFISYIFLALVAVLLFIYRNPERELASLEDSNLLSLVDGKVIGVEDIDDEYYAKKIVIESGYSDIGVLRVPMNSTLVSFEEFKGSKLSSNALNLVNKLNENTTLVFEVKDLYKIRVEHSLRDSINNISINIASSDTVVAGSRYGYMLNGITTIYLPKEVELNVSSGVELSASQTIIGHLSK